MKKQNNISVLAFYILLAVLCFTACTDDTWEDNSSNVKEGIPVNITLQFQTSTAEKVSSRALTDAGEFQVNDLYLLVFDKDGNKKEGSNYYNTEALAAFNHINGSQANPTHGVITKLKTTSGQSYIFGIANVADNELDRDSKLKTQLDNISSLTELRALVTTLNNDGNIARSSASLLMSGAFQAIDANDIDKEEGKCIIPVTDGQISGKLHLRRLDSHITFNITLGEKILDFELECWQVCKVPVNSFLIDRKSQYPEAKYADSGEQKEYDNKVKRQYSFNFYMQENLKKALTAEETKDGTVISDYKDREKEIKNQDGTNSGIYKYVEPNATFVEIKAKMNIKPTGGNEFRTADVKYTIHLGGGATDYANFNSLRNKKYTYNVRIEDVDQIIVEVISSEDDADARPGAEGSVVDAQAEVYVLDAHYNCFNIGFTYEDIVDNLSFIIYSPFAPNTVYSSKGNIGGTLENTARENGDYKWIEFQRAESETTLAKYKRDFQGQPTTPLTLYDLEKDMKARSSAGDGKIYYYTVFIDEYYYDEAPTAATKNTWKEPLWSNFVNKEDRKVLLFLEPKYSEDKESSYSRAKYMIRQKSIQTYYSTDVFNTDQNALGMEHINETGAPEWKKTTTADNWQQSNGFYNTNRYFDELSTAEADNISNADRKKWETFVNYDISPDFPYTYHMADVTAIAECLSRNRDENGNGIIDPDELKWYLPATDQLLSMFLGAKSLPSPLFDDKSISEVEEKDGNNHYMTSDKQKVWAEEGCSFGALNAEFGKKPYPKHLRCVRNLGLSNEDAKTKTVGPVYEYDPETNIFSMRQLANQNKRPGKVTGELDFHDNFDDTNRPYQAFEMAKEFIGQKNSTWDILFDTDQSHRSLCKNLKQDGKTWRAPNQREFMIMFLQDKNNVKKNKTYSAFSRTHWKYGKSRHFGFNGGDIDFLFLDTKKNLNRTIRCVRDVDVDSNGNIIE